MAIYSRAEIVKTFGKSHAYIKVNIDRGKIILNKDGKIDSDNPYNADFLSKLSKKKQIPKKTVKQKAEQASRIISDIKYSEKDTEKEGLSAYQIEKKTKEAEFEKKKQEIELNRLKIAKLKGDVIPTDLVKVVFGQHFKSVTTAFHQGADGFISTVAKRAGIEKKELATLRGELISIVNKAVKDAVKDSQASVNNIVREYSAKRGVGERK